MFQTDIACGILPWEHSSLLGLTPVNGRGLTPFNPNLVPLLMFGFHGRISVLLFTIIFVSAEKFLDCVSETPRGLFRGKISFAVAI